MRGISGKNLYAQPRIYLPHSVTPAGTPLCTWKAVNLVAKPHFAGLHEGLKDPTCRALQFGKKEKSAVVCFFLYNSRHLFFFLGGHAVL